MVARTLASRHPGVQAPQGAITALTPGLLVFRADGLPTVPAFFHWKISVEGVHSPGRKFKAEAPLVRGSTAIPFVAPRGRYRVAVRWRLDDLFGFTRLVPAVSWESILIVEPKPQFFTPPRPPAQKPGTGRPRPRDRQAGDPFDVRPYVPGDDLRRLHWPLFAHAGTPFLRTADPSPPPAGRQFLVLDTWAETEEDLDVRLGCLVTWLTALSAQGAAWTLAVPSAGQVLRPTSDLGPALAALEPGLLPDRPLPQDWPQTLTLVTGTPAPRTTGWLRQAAQSRRQVVTVETPAASLARPVLRRWWERRP